MNEYAPIDINYVYTNLPTKSPVKLDNSAVVYLYNDTVNPNSSDMIPPLSALVDNINSNTAVFGDIIIGENGNQTATPPNKHAINRTIVMPNSLDDDMTTKFFIGSLTIVGLYMLYRMILKNK